MSKRSGDLSHPQDAPQMDQVRDLLFGAQLKDMETRFKRQEERFMREVADCRDGLKTRLDSLENFMKSEIATILHRLKEEQNERDESLKIEQRERGETLRSEQRERSEALKNEQRERAEAVSLLSKEIATAVAILERKIAKVSSTLDTAERELRRILLEESGSLSNKIEERYQNALDVLANTAAQIRHDMVYRSSFSAMLTEMAVKLSGQWSSELSPLVAIQDTRTDDDDTVSRVDDDHGSEDA
ncbi:MAG: hypothetical protein LBD42_03770 [Desulfovibrio sp.]|jgi:hypothetical protein|nr:hypothetical protein [Desulfovibrio sp.]